MIDERAWTPLGRALLDHLEGKANATPVVILEDGQRMAFPATILFRGPEEFSPAEVMALELCHGRVLDAGAGAGSHALELQERALEVTALDVCPLTVEVMRRRGVEQPCLGDVFTTALEPCDTLLMLMNGIGLVGDLEGLDRFLVRAAEILAPDGQILFDSGDLRELNDLAEDQRIARREAAGQYHGETTQVLEYDGEQGPPLGWLYVDAETLGKRARRRGWNCQVLYMEDGEYLARLRRD